MDRKDRNSLMMCAAPVSNTDNNATNIIVWKKMIKRECLLSPEADKFQIESNFRNR